MTYARRFALMLWAHAICDFPLQGDFLALGKNRHTEIGKAWWRIALPAHAIIHGGAVFLVTDSLAIGVAEATIHAVTDYAKCEGWLTIEQDQAIHVACKILWAAHDPIR